MQLVPGACAGGWCLGIDAGIGLKRCSEDMPFARRAREAFKGESCVAKCLFHCPFAAVGKEYGAGCTAGGNGAEYCLIPQFGLGGR